MTGRDESVYIYGRYIGENARLILDLFLKLHAKRIK